VLIGGGALVGMAIICSGLWCMYKSRYRTVAVTTPHPGQKHGFKNKTSTTKEPPSIVKMPSKDKDGSGKFSHRSNGSGKFSSRSNRYDELVDEASVKRSAHIEHETSGLEEVSMAQSFAVRSPEPVIEMSEIRQTAAELHRLNEEVGTSKRTVSVDSEAPIEREVSADKTVSFEPSDQRHSGAV
jgi:hypothetical protein